MHGVIIGTRRMTRNLPTGITWDVLEPTINDGTHYGCLHSHLSVWSTVYEHTIVVEDDCIFQRSLDVSELLPQARQWDFLYLGGQPISWKPPTKGMQASDLGSRGFCRTHAYVIGLGAAIQLTNWKWDPTEPWGMIPEWRVGLRVGLLWPPLAGQAEGTSSITGRTVPERWWYTPYDHAVSEHLNNER